MSEQWHTSPETIRHYADGIIDRANAASIEEHLLKCAACRVLATQASDRERLAAVWNNVRAEADRPALPWSARALMAFGAREHVARIITATPSLTASWFVAVIVALSWGVFLSRHSGAPPVIFLMIAPLIPLTGVALAYGPRVDPTYEIALAAPMSSFRLFILRAGTVLVSTVALTGIASVALPSMGWRAAAWLLPALAVTCAASALSSWFSPATASTAVATAWLLLMTVTYSMRTGAALSRFAAFEPDGQIMFAAIALAGALAVVVRAQRFDLRRNP